MIFKRLLDILGKSKGLSAMVISTITANGISAVFWLYMASLLGSENYGEVNYLISIAIIATTIAIFGANPTIIVYTAKGEKIAPVLFVLAGLSGLIVSIIVFFIFNSIGTSLLIIGSVVFGLATSELIGRGLYKKYGKYLVVQKILMVGFAISLYHLLDLEGVVIGIALSYLPFTLLIYKGMKSGNIQLSILKPKRFFMINNYSLEISRIFGGHVDKLIIAPLLGFALLGNYQLGFQFFLLISILPSIVYQYSLPQDSKGITNYSLKRKTIVLCIGISILSFIFSPYLISNLFPTYLEAVQIIQIMSFALIPKTINLMNTSYLIGKEKMKFILIGVIIYLVSQISLILILGELYGINGVASSLIIALSIESLFLHMAKKHVDSNEKLSF
jgi:O-antigen/teichoic acid export membrane protein